jgi:4-aminobutyrate aminotransferase
MGKKKVDLNCPRKKSMFFRQPTKLLLRRGEQRRAIISLTAAEEKRGKELLSPVCAHLTDEVVDRGSGSWLQMTSGRRYLDFTTGIGVTNIGHAHPRVVAAVQEAAAEVLHAQHNIVYHKPQLALLNKLGDHVLPQFERFFFTNSGAEAVESSIKLARHATGRTNVVVMQGGFHGRTIGTMSLTTSKYVMRAGYQPLMPGVFVAPYPYCAHCDTCPSSSSCCLKPIEKLEELLMQQSSPSETAAIILEPVLGEGGYVPAPHDYMRALRALCDRHGILLIVDEVQSGFGRTGDWFAFNHVDAMAPPDIVVAAKGIASGMPLSMIAANERIMSKWAVGSHGGTYAGNAVSCAAACATIDAIRDEDMLDNCRARSAELFGRLNALQNEFPSAVRDVRGVGLMVGIEFQPHLVGAAAAIVKKCLDNDLLILTTSIYETIRFIPPINISVQDLDTGITIFENATREYLAEHN